MQVQELGVVDTERILVLRHVTSFWVVGGFISLLQVLNDKTILSLSARFRFYFERMAAQSLQRGLDQGSSIRIDVQSVCRFCSPLTSFSFSHRSPVLKQTAGQPRRAIAAPQPVTSGLHCAFAAVPSTNREWKVSHVQRRVKWNYIIAPCPVCRQIGWVLRSTTAAAPRLHVTLAIWNNMQSWE